MVEFIGSRHIREYLIGCYDLERIIMGKSITESADSGEEIDDFEGTLT
jgi:hypothetical protein